MSNDDYNRDADVDMDTHGCDEVDAEIDDALWGRDEEDDGETEA